jgi:hypothetical protein
MTASREVAAEPPAREIGSMTQATETARSVPRPRRLWFRYNLSTMLALVTVLCMVLGLWVQRAERQRRAVAAICSLKGVIHYEDDELVTNTAPSIPWLRELLGNDYFADVYWVSLTDTQISNAGLDHLKGLPGLRVLYLNSMELSDQGLRGLKGLTELEVLYLSNTRVSDAGCEHLKGLAKLKILTLSDTRVTGAGLQHLKGLTKLEVLKLSGTPITDPGLEHLKGLRDLRWLNLERTWVSESGCERLQEMLPNCQIIRTMRKTDWRRSETE